MNDEERLRDLIDRGCAERGWRSDHAINGLYYSGRNLMLHLGGFEALCLAEHDQLQAWVNTKLSSKWSAYGNLVRIRNIYDFLIDDGVIGANPAIAIKVDYPTKDETRRRPPMDLKDVRRVFAHAKKRSITLEGAKSYVVLCLRVRCGMQYASMAQCRRSDLLLGDGGGTLLAVMRNRRTRRQVVYKIDPETAWAFENYFRLRGPAEDDDPLIAKHGYHGTEAGGFYRGSVLQDRVAVLMDHCGLKVGDYDLNKTMVMLAYAEGANAVQAAALAANDSVTLAVRVAEELPCADPNELRRRLLEEFDSDEVVAVGMMAPEDVMNAVAAAYRRPYLKVIVQADGWAKFEIPGEGA